MNWKEAFEAWFDDTGRVDYRPELCIAWYSAIEWVRSQQAPVAWFIDDDEGGRECNAKPEFSRGRTGGTPLYAALVPREPEGWQPIETEPKGARGYAWMMLAWGVEDDTHTGNGMRCGDKFFAVGTFYCLGQEKQYELREIEVHPTHWKPLSAAPEYKEE